MDSLNLDALSCPAPLTNHEQIMLGHGSGGRLSADLLRKVFLPAFANDILIALEDQATLSLGGSSRLAFTTDSFVVRPLFFPGGDIGKLAVHGTVNDLAVGGACRSPTCGASLPRCAMPAGTPASRWSQATRK